MTFARVSASDAPDDDGGPTQIHWRPRRWRIEPEGMFEEKRTLLTAEGSATSIQLGLDALRSIAAYP